MCIWSGIPPEIREQINGCEWELRSISSNKEIPRGEWEDLVPGPGNTTTRNSLFNKSIQHYWIMKHVVARAMEMNQEDWEEEEEERK